MWRIFDDWGAKSNSEHKSVKASASEVLHLYALLRHWVETRLPLGDDRIAQAMESFLAVCKAVDIILLAKRLCISPAVASDKLSAALEEFMRLHRSAHGDLHMRPKHHWAFDVAEQLGADATVFDAFVIERLHLRVRSVAENVKRLQTFERSVLSGIVNEHSRRTQENCVGGGLLGKVAPFPQLPSALVSDKLELGGFRAAVGDYVFCNEELGVVVACCIDDSELFLVVDVAQRVTNHSVHSSTWSVRAPRRQVWRVADTTECATWLHRHDDEVVAIHM